MAKREERAVTIPITDDGVTRAPSAASGKPPAIALAKMARSGVTP